MTTAGGFQAKLKLNYCGILAHAMYTVPVIGGFYIYCIVEFFLGTDSSPNSGFSETWILMITSLPLLGLFCMGIYSIYLVALIEEELESRKKQAERVGPEIQEPPPRNQNRPAENVRQVRQRNINQYSQNPEEAHRLAQEESTG